MATRKISTLSAGTIVKSKINGTYYDIAILHQGKPSADYDDSCNGTWVMPIDCLAMYTFGTTGNYAESEINIALNNSFIGSIENGLRNVIKTVKLPYSPNQSSVNTGANGIETRIFLPSAAEVGLSGNFNVEGAQLSYFTDNSKRIGSYNGVNRVLALRTPSKNDSSKIIAIDTDGNWVEKPATEEFGIRPVFVIYDTCLVDDDNVIKPDISPVITSTMASDGGNLGRKADSFAFTYTVTTSRPDLTLAIEEELSGTDVSKTKQIISNPISGQQRTFSVVVDDADDFRSLMNGSKTITIRAYYSDYNEASVNSEAEFNVTFEKFVNEATITLSSPLTHSSGTITKGIITIEGNIPDDATFQVKATNNANDTSPTWQDVTNYVRTRTDFEFTNTTVANGSAFNFQIHVKRGASEETGYIAAVVGAFE